MAKGHQANKERLEEIASFGKAVSKRAAFACEWCGVKEDLRVWDYRPELQPVMETLALLCKDCRELANGRKAGSEQLRAIRDALWSDVPAVAEGAATVLSQCSESWVRDALDESFIDDVLKAQLLAPGRIWK